ncbi:hypothetical protein HDU85_006883 [Gaertneriomyces sp. JEL0708]|nr:hypothetical protein HDU85_006883 [Gaertneriomyces sp. JEL0708]
MNSEPRRHTFHRKFEECLLEIADRAFDHVDCFTLKVALRNNQCSSEMHAFEWNVMVFDESPAVPVADTLTSQTSGQSPSSVTKPQPSTAVDDASNHANHQLALDTFTLPPSEMYHDPRTNAFEYREDDEPNDPASNDADSQSSEPHDDSNQSPLIDRMAKARSAAIFDILEAGFGSLTQPDADDDRSMHDQPSIELYADVDTDTDQYKNDLVESSNESDNEQSAPTNIKRRRSRRKVSDPAYRDQTKRSRCDSVSDAMNVSSHAALLTAPSHLESSSSGSSAMLQLVDCATVNDAQEVESTQDLTQPIKKNYLNLRHSIDRIKQDVDHYINYVVDQLKRVNKNGDKWLGRPVWPSATYDATFRRLFAKPSVDVTSASFISACRETLLAIDQNKRQAAVINMTAFAAKCLLVQHMCRSYAPDDMGWRAAVAELGISNPGGHLSMASYLLKMWPNLAYDPTMLQDWPCTYLNWAEDTWFRAIADGKFELVIEPAVIMYFEQKQSKSSQLQLQQ